MIQVPSPEVDVRSTLLQTYVPQHETPEYRALSPYSPPLHERNSLTTDTGSRRPSATVTTEFGSSLKQRPRETASQSSRSDALSDNDVDRIAARLAGYVGPPVVVEDVVGGVAPPSYVG